RMASVWCWFLPHGRIRSATTCHSFGKSTCQTGAGSRYENASASATLPRSCGHPAPLELPEEVQESRWLPVELLVITSNTRSAAVSFGKLTVCDTALPPAALPARSVPSMVATASHVRRPAHPRARRG